MESMLGLSICLLFTLYADHMQRIILRKPQANTGKSFYVTACYQNNSRVAEKPDKTTSWNQHWPPEERAALNMQGFAHPTFLEYLRVELEEVPSAATLDN
eukprot:CAMPEP_0175089852 /NCGR_PEP_ID=MMETSP0086_2-20121207/1009_1 /TAXON_ID=136419 /ORGANISM="Unknown Unknown, Strain D1" /LENGTH=99 /DNA_ID=CAMNT_0016362393 /DNA_START=1 /DNA_END=300 /DNA_ORIENTATION=+